jgi:hypothetical protein
LIEWGIIESLGRYALVPYWKCLPNSKNRKLIGFKDLVSNNTLYNFQDLSQRKNQKNTRRRSKSGLIDMRDKLLLNAVLSDFVNAEYFKDKTRRIVRRSEKDSSLVQRKKVLVPAPTKKNKDKVVKKVVETKSLIEGKSTLRGGILNLYKKDTRYSRLSNTALLKRLQTKFIKAKILHPKDNMMQAHAYLALWLNAPVQKNEACRG